jgi:hypothetical protein
MTDRAWMACRWCDGSVAITAAVLEKCLDRVALLIAESGDKGVVYLPIYDRLEAELEALKAREDRMARIRARIRR